MDKPIFAVATLAHRIGASGVSIDSAIRAIASVPETLPEYAEKSE
jgi:hypothetical protein